MNIGVIGLGLIGGSICRTLKKKTEHTVYAYTRSEKTMANAYLAGAYDVVLSKDNAKELDVLFIALYPQAIIDYLKEYAPFMKKGAILVDCGGNKRGICEEMEKLQEEYPDLYFVGGHPMAGREFSGFSHSTTTVFDNATFLLVPINNTPIEVRATIKHLVQELGFSGVVITNAKEHDEMISYTSQLAHIVSSAYIKNKLATEHYGFSAGSFRDMTRVARLNPQMWTELMFNNSDYLVEQIDVIIKNLEDYREALRNKDEGQLTKLLQDGSDIKEKVEAMRAEMLSKKVDK